MQNLREIFNTTNIVTEYYIARKIYAIDTHKDYPSFGREFNLQLYSVTSDIL